MKCNTSENQLAGSDTNCPDCGSPSPKKSRVLLWGMLWAIVVLVLLILLIKNEHN